MIRARGLARLRAVPPLGPAAALALILAAAPALAQREAAQIPVPLLDTAGAGFDAREHALARGDRFEPDDTRAGTLAAAGAAAPHRPALISPLRPVEARGRPTGSALRFDGERRSLDFVVFLPDPDRVDTMRIATLSSINVLAERSSFAVILNGTRLGGAQLVHVTETGEFDFAVPPGLARPGLNDVRIELSQYHRIFCGPEAAFALWTDIDLARSGALIAEDEERDRTLGSPVGREYFTMGVAAAAVTGAGIEIRGTEHLGVQRDAWVGMLTQQIAAAMGGEPIPFRFTPTWSVAGPQPARARITFRRAPVPEIRFALGGDGAQVMVIGVPPGAGPEALPDLAGMFPALPRRPAPPLLTAGARVPLAEIGFRDTEHRDRYALTELRFRLPDDYVVLTNLKAYVNLTYIYADQLPEGAMMQVHVNGTNVRLLPLRGEAGQLIEDLSVRFEARLLRGGVNTLAFETFVPGAPPDLPCPQREAPVVAVSAQSTIEVPYSPSMYLADMHYAFAGMHPASVQTSDLTGRAFSELDVLMLRAAFATGRRSDAQAVAARLHLIPPDDLGAVPSSGYQISRGVVEQVLAPPAAEPLLLAAAGEPEHLLLRTERQRDGAGPAALSAGWDWMTRMATDALQWMHPRAGNYLEAWLSQQSGQAILLQLDPLQPSQIWMLRAPDSDAQAIAAAIVAARAQGEGPRGQVSVLDRDGNWRNWYAPDRQPILLEPISLANIRYVTGNFVSAMPIRFVTLLFFLAMLSAVFALRLVIVTREN